MQTPATVPGATKRRFDKVNIEVTNVCNLQCSFCPEVLRGKGFIDVELFRSVISQVAPLTRQVCFHLMGDPLLHPRLGELVEICSAAGVEIFLVTNAVALRPQTARLLLHPAFRQVCFSLHSFHDNFGDKDPTAYLERIFAFTEAAFAERPELYINYRLWNLDSVRGGDVNNRGLLSRIEERFAFRMSATVDPKVRKSFRIKNRLYAHFDSEFQWPQNSLPVIGEKGTCYGLSSHFGVLVDGTVVPCCLDKEGDIALGNAREFPVGQILDSPRARRMLDGFRRNRLVESLCQRCQYIERFQ